MATAAAGAMIYLGLQNNSLIEATLYKYIRQIFSVFVLGMIVLFVMRLNVGEWSTLNWVMMAVSAIACLLVFRCFVFVFNISYSLACVFNGAILVLELPSAGSIILGGAMVIYGLRLLLFTWNRLQSESYRPRVDNVKAEDDKLPFAVKIALWVQCTFMYTFHMFAVYLVATGEHLSSAVIVGAAIILVGTCIEGLADKQKQVSKRKAPGEFVANGLYSRWRHPNYAGEIIVQIGLIVAGVAAVSAGWENYAAVTIAPFYIILLMLSECTRLDRSQQLQYGDSGSYKDYVARSGSLFPRP